MNTTTTGFRVPRLFIGVLVAAILAGLAGCGGSSSETVAVMATPTATATPPILGSSGAVICNGSPKTTDQFQDLVVKSGVCTIPAGKWVFNNVNIYGTGTCPNKTTCNPGILRFDDVATDFYANSILVENGGSLIAGLDSANNLKPIGTSGGRLTIHLYGKDQGISGAGITCQSPTDASTGPCGIPLAIWNNDHTKKVSFDNGVSDYFYQYDTLPFDDATTDGQPGYFGYKVLAVSYGGTLQLFGKEGAVYVPPAGGVAEPGPKSSGRSWGRLDGSLSGPTTANPDGDQTLKVDSPLPIDWQMGDHIVVTSTDYLADHAEELEIDQPPSGNTIHFTAACYLTVPQTCKTKGVRWTHNGEPFSLSGLSARLKISKSRAETRAAVGLLTRSIQIVSAGDTSSDSFYQVGDPKHPNYFFGGHTIFRQGFEKVQVQGVEFKQLGQGGKLAHYPVHFHLCRQLPADTYVKDSSIDESMTRWIAVHATQGVTLARNVAYLSIGAGFYLEDGTETDNKLYSNLGVFARAAIKNPDNPRNIPGILASPPDAADPRHKTNYTTDQESPTDFWITNGWNDFQGNMAAGAGMCGVCYWELPASISGPSRAMKWESYASEQQIPAMGDSRAGSSPLKNFDGNYCSSAMGSINTVGYVQNCPGVGPDKPAVPVPNPLAPPVTAKPPTCGPGTAFPICPGDYYPLIGGGDLAQATQCPATGVCDNTTAPLCQETNETNCLPTVINDLTTSFNYPNFNFAGVWLRLRWHLFSNSFISDVQNGGLTFVSGGDYTHASAINGLWETAIKTVFVGETQPRDKAHAYASVLSPFNQDALGLTCDNPDVGAYCISVNNSFTLGGFTNFAISERMFSIYDGPANEDSNAFIDINRYDLGVNYNPSIYKTLLGIPKAVNAASNVAKGDCYIPNAAIAWKQPNGFYYPPTFHSRNLFFNNVDIRHYVIDPLFVPGTYQTDPTGLPERYCSYAPTGMFNGFSSIDRETELTDDDGSLTGYAKTISVNEDPFFAAPVDGPECESDDSVPETGTARTSPYQYLTTVIYPECAVDAATGACGAGVSTPQTWGSDCSNPGCYGVPLYREDLTGSENLLKPPLPQNLRMAGMAIYQRETMTVNHGHYYVDTTPSEATQLANIKGNNSTYCTNPYPGVIPPPPNTPVNPCAVNVFQAGQTYNLFFVYGTPDIEQTYQMYVGPGLDWDPVKKTSTNVQLIRASIVSVPFVITPGTGGDANTLKLDYDGNILTATVSLSAYAGDYATAAQNLCLPNSFCTYDTTANKCKGAGAGMGTLFPSLTQDEQDLACTYAGKDIDCPTGGCVGFSVTLPSAFVAQDQTTTNKLLSPLLGCFPEDANWNIFPAAALPNLAGSCAGAPLNRDFCPATGTEPHGPDGLFSAARPAGQRRE